MDYDAPGSAKKYELVINVEDGQHSVEVSVMVIINPVNEHPPVFTPVGVTFTEAEDMSVGSFIGIHSATDADYDPSNAIQYRIAEG